jgi:hypothetical protein
VHGQEEHRPTQAKGERMTTQTIPDGWWVRSNLEDHTLEWGDTDQIWGDYIEQECLGEILDEMRNDPVPSNWPRQETR